MHPRDLTTLAESICKAFPDPYLSKLSVKPMTNTVHDHRPKATAVTQDIGDLATGTFFYGRIDEYHSLWIKAPSGCFSIIDPRHYFTRGVGLLASEFQPVSVEIHVKANA